MQLFVSRRHDVGFLHVPRGRDIWTHLSRSGLRSITTRVSRVPQPRKFPIRLQCNAFHARLTIIRFLRVAQSLEFFSRAFERLLSLLGRQPKHIYQIIPLCTIVS